MRSGTSARTQEQLSRTQKTAAPPSVLTINGGSSSIRFAVFEASGTERRWLHGKVDRIGLSGTKLVVMDPAENAPITVRLAATDHRAAVKGVTP